VQRLYEKLDAIRRTVGLDTSTLGEAVDPKEFNAVRRIQAQDLSIFDELEQASELTVGEFVKQELLDLLKKIGEERLQTEPHHKLTPDTRSERTLHGRQPSELLFNAPAREHATSVTQNMEYLS
jgi:hypothetical protein